jgi:hypothetical protein
MKLDRDAFTEVFMIPISSALSDGLIWSKISCSRNYELKLNNELVGRLHKPNFWSSEFEAETQAGRWIFRRGGFCGTGATIVDSVSKQPVATSRSSWGGRGTLTFTDGQTFQVGCKGWWHPVWSVFTESGQPVLHIQTREKVVDLPAGSAVTDDRLALLIMFTWYCRLRAEEDAAAVVMVAAVS